MKLTFAVDIDGTITENGDGRIHLDALSSLRDAESAGHNVIFVTGRSSIEGYILAMFAGTTKFCIGENGGCITSGNYVHKLLGRKSDCDEALKDLQNGMENVIEKPVYPRCIVQANEARSPLRSKTQINKATEHHIVKAKIAKLRREQEDEHTKKKGAKTDGFDVRRAGDATVVLIGLPSVGKSTLLNRMTDAKSTVGAFQFTTLTVVPGMMEYKGAQIQILDLPGIIKGASSGRGLGKRILSVARSADLVLLVLDVFQPYHEEILVTELANIGIRLNQNPPNVVIEKTHTGGIAVAQQKKLTKISEKFLKDILNLYGMTTRVYAKMKRITSGFQTRNDKIYFV